MNEIIQKLWNCKYSFLFFILYTLITRYIPLSNWYASSMILYFPNLQKVDVHIKDRIFKFITIIILYILYVLITKEISIKPDITSLINFFNGTFIGLLIIITHTIVSLLTGSIKIKGYNFNYKLILYVIYIYFIGMIMTAFTEELVMRGVLQHSLSKFFNKEIIILCLSLIFGLWHIGSGILYAIGAFITGILFGVLYIQKGFYICFGLHFGHNFFESIFNSQTIIKYKNIKPFLNGYRDTPDETGFIDIMIYLALTIYVCLKYYT